MQTSLILDWLFLLLLYFFFLYPRFHQSPYQLFTKTCFYFYVCFVCYYTIMPFLLPLPYLNFQPDLHANLIPFQDLLMHHGGARTEAMLNVLLMVPMGILLPFLYHTSAKKTILIVFLSSCFIELYQLCSVRGLNHCDVSDLITNTMGGILGYGIYALFHTFAQRFLLRLFPDTPFSHPAWRCPEKASKVVFAILLFFLFFRSLFYRFL